MHESIKRPKGINIFPWASDTQRQYFKVVYQSFQPSHKADQEFISRFFPSRQRLGEIL